MDNDRADMVIDRVYISSLRVAEKETVLRRLGITHVLTICPMRPKHYAGIKYKLISISDSPEHRIDVKFEESHAFINEALHENGAVLVHCFQGVSRSASIVISYLISHCNMNFEEAFRFLRSKRNIINPNYGFINQLRNYSKKLGKNY